MNKFQKVIPLFLLAIQLVIGQSQKIIHLDGSYDLDGDKWQEFIALELNPSEEYFPSSVHYYEVDNDGYQTKTWEFSPPDELEGYFVNAIVGDIQGDGTPDLITVMNLSRFGDNSSPHVLLRLILGVVKHFLSSLLPHWMWGNRVNHCDVIILLY